MAHLTDYRDIFRLYVRPYPAGNILHVSKRLIEYYKNKNTHADSVLVMAESSRKRNSVLPSTLMFLDPCIIIQIV
jgi:hypothetical protein